MRDSNELLRFAEGDTVVFLNPNGTTSNVGNGVITRVGVSWVFASFPPEYRSVAYHPDRLAVVTAP